MCAREGTDRIGKAPGSLGASNRTLPVYIIFAIFSRSYNAVLDFWEIAGRSFHHTASPGGFEPEKGHPEPGLPRDGQGNGCLSGPYLLKGTLASQGDLPMAEICR